MKNTLVALFILAMFPAVAAAGNIKVTTFPYDSFVAVFPPEKEKANKPVMTGNGPVTFKDVKNPVRICAAKRMYDLGDCPIVSPASGRSEIFLKLEPVTPAAADMLVKSSGNMDMLLQYMELFPQLVDKKFYGSMQDAMAAEAKKQKNFNPASTVNTSIYSNKLLGIYAVSGYTPRKGVNNRSMNPIAPTSAEETAEKNYVTIYYTDKAGKPLYVYHHACAKFYSLKVEPAAKGPFVNVTEEYSSMHFNNLEGEIRERLEYRVSIPDFKVQFGQITWNFVKDGKLTDPLTMKIAGAGK